MGSHKHTITTQVCFRKTPAVTNPSAKKRQSTPPNLQSAVKKCRDWSRQLERQEEPCQRDRKRVDEAFEVLAKEDEDNSYGAFLKDAELIGGSELVVLFALAFGKSAFRDMKGEVKWRLSLRVAETKCHRTASLRRLVRGLVRKAELACSRQSSPRAHLASGAAETHSSDAAVEPMIRSLNEAWDPAPDAAATEAPAPPPSKPASSEDIASIAPQTPVETGKAASSGIQPWTNVSCRLAWRDSV